MLGSLQTGEGGTQNQRKFDDKNKHCMNRICQDALDKLDSQQINNNYNERLKWLKSCLSTDQRFQSATDIKQYISMNIVLIAENNKLIVMERHRLFVEILIFFYNANEINWEKIW